MTATLRIRITPSLGLDYSSREIASAVELEGGPNPYSKIEAIAGVGSRGGDVDLSPAEAAVLLADADFYADDELGPELSVGMRNAYRLLAGRLRSAGVVAAEPEPAPVEDRLGRLLRLQAEDEAALEALGEPTGYAVHQADRLRRTIASRAKTIARLANPTT